MKKLSILINAMNRGGAERVVSILLEDLVQHYDVFLIVLHSGVAAYPIPDKVKQFQLCQTSGNANNFSKAFQLFFLGYKYALFCKKNKIDISLSLLNRANYINIFSKFFGSKHKTVISERGTTIEEYPKNSLKGKVSRLLIRWLYPKANAIIAISKGIAIDLTKVFGIAPQKITTIYNPIDLKNLNASSDVIQDNKKEFQFIAIGRLDKSKNFEFLLHAFSKLTLSAKLTILGDGPLRESLKKLIVDLGISDKVNIFESTADIFSHLKSANCFVSSSSHEGLSNVIIEALGYGKAIIATDCKYGPSEILAEKIFPSVNDKFIFEKYGILVPLNNPDEFSRAMHEIIINKTKRSEYEALGPQRANYFHKDAIFLKYRNILENKITH